MEKKIPMRQCLGCRKMRPKRNLVRVVRTPEQGVQLDLRGKISGRGAYICPNSACFGKAMKSKAFERALACSIPEELLQQMREQLEAGE